MISLDKITLVYGDRELFKGVSFMINPKDRIGLVGKNGAGKSTLLKMINGEIKPDSGTIVVPGDATIGYLPQHMKHNDDTSIVKETEKAFKEILNIQNDIKKLEKNISESADFESEQYHNWLTRLAHQNERLSIFESGTKDEKIEQCLTGLGFKKEDFKKATAALSGGWRMRVEIAKILLQEPDILLLDEPTNHLDIESIEWIEEFIKSYNGAVVLISHDRAFLDNITKRTIEISLGNIYDYNVPYSHFVELKKERREQQMATFRNQQKMINDTEKFIERFRYKATKAVQVQSRIKQLNKIDRIEVEEDDVASIKIKFPPAPRSGALVVEAEDLSKSYGSNLVLDKISIKIERGEKVAFVGRNGEGKTTLSRIIIGELDYTGNNKPGHNVKIGYYAQNQDAILNEKRTVFETVDAVAVGDIRTKIRDILGAFLFSGEDIDKKVRVLSGGERSRLAIAKLLLEPYNLLVLDEPTNHLDIHSKELLKDALKKYDGTLILVSHDRHFLDGLVSKVFEFKDKKIKEHLGGIYEFLARKKMTSLKELEKKKQILNETPGENEISVSKTQYLERKEHDKKIRKVSKQIEEKEILIHSLESELEKLDELLSNTEKMKDENPVDVYRQYEEIKKDLEKEMLLWQNLNEELEQLNNERI